MKIEEKVNKVETLFNKQKKILSELNTENFLESLIKIRILEVQKHIVISIPTKKPLN
jgi:hypothetical protein